MGSRELATNTAHVKTIPNSYLQDLYMVCGFFDSSDLYSETRL